jgi:NAD(P)H dehydrogenase (quinone)
MSAASGKSITFVDQTVEEAYASRAVYGAPDWQVEAWVTTYTAIAGGDIAAVTDTVPHFTGHPATSLADYLGAHPQALDHVTG